MSAWDVMRPTIRLTLQLPCSCQHYKLQVSTHKGKMLSFKGLASQQELGWLRRRLGSDIDKFKDKVGSRLDLTQRFDQVDDAMRSLHKAGNSFLGDFLGGARRLPELRNACEEALYYWPNDYPPVIEIRGEREAMLPVEFLPLFGHGPYRPIASLEDLTTYVARYAGFRGVVYRTMVTEGRAARLSPRDRYLLLDEARLPVKLFYHAKLRGAVKEADFLKLLKDAALVELEGPWPEAGNGARRESAIELLYEHLSNPRLSLHGGARSVGDQVQHFACHCDSAPPDDPSPGDAEHEFPRIRLAAQGATWVVEITREDLLQAVIDGPPRPRYTKLPLLFMNACDTSRIDPDTATSFVKYFLDQGNPAFIGTVSAMPDSVAAEFSRLFYKELIRGRNVGTAVWSVRNRILRRRANPLGLLYAAYGDPRMSTREVKVQKVNEHAA